MANAYIMLVHLSREVAELINILSSELCRIEQQKQPCKGLT